LIHFCVRFNVIWFTSALNEELVFNKKMNKNVQKLHNMQCFSNKSYPITTPTTNNGKNYIFWNGLFDIGATNDSLACNNHA